MTPYSRLASVYDRVMDHVGYDDWAVYLSSLCSLYGKDVATILDAGCGTGSIVGALEQMGYVTAGFDRSLNMILKAKEKTGIRLWVGDLTARSYTPGWDAVLCTYDTIQYLPEDELGLFFDTVREAVNDGGLLVFDVVTESHVFKYWADYKESYQIESVLYTRYSWYDRKKRLLFNELTFVDIHDRKKCFERHCQTIYRLSDIEKKAVLRGWKVVACLEDFTLKTGNENSDRVHFVLRREDA